MRYRRYGHRVRSESDETLRVVFVCSGNICRSPMAALVFGERLRQAGMADAVRVRSVGVGPWHVGEPADPRAAKKLAEAGYPTEHTAAQLGDDDLDADLLLAMDSGHHEVLIRRAGPERVRMLRSFDPHADAADLDVPDPYYGGRDGFDEVLTMIEAAMPGLLDWVRRATPDGS